MTIHSLGDDSEFAGIGSFESLNKDKVLSLGEVLATMKAIKGSAYVTAILIQVNTFNLVSQILISLTKDCPEAEKVSRIQMIEAVLNNNLVLFNGLMHPTLSTEELTNKLDELYKDYETVIDINMSIIKGD